MRPFIYLALLFTPLALFADVQPASVFTDHLVLQRDRPIPVWGQANAGERVRVSFAGAERQTTALQDGTWRVTLPAQAANAEGRALEIAGENRIVLQDVLVGEVWLVSGQSNMEWRLSATFDADLDISSASAFPSVRHFKVARQVALSPQTNVKSDHGWAVSSAETGDFSAVAHYFARELSLHLDVPVGIVDSSWGGSAIEPWMTPQALQQDPAWPRVDERWKKMIDDYPDKKQAFDAALAEWETRRDAANAAGESFSERRPRGPANQNARDYPSNLYHGMIHGLAPIELQGVLWYQGESNANRPDEYQTLFPSLIRDWRAVFDDEELEFYWVQLASYDARTHPDDRKWAYLREAQTQALELPKTGDVVTLDIGDVNDIHPRNKLDVGRRLARLALNRVYGFDIADQGPTFVSAQQEADGIRVTFEATEGKLRTPSAELLGFEIAGEDRDFAPAQATIEGDTVFLQNPAVNDPVAVRYAWKNAPPGGLFNEAGLPARPFRTDDW